MLIFDLIIKASDSMIKYKVSRYQNFIDLLADLNYF